jgi:hypothetical protein
MKQDLRNRIFAFGFLILMMLVVIGFILNSVYSEDIVRTLHNSFRIVKIEMKYNSFRDNEPSKQVIIQDTDLLKNINEAFRNSREVGPKDTRMIKSSIDMQIYKNKKVRISLLNSNVDGWVIYMGGSWYKSDTLMKLLTAYIPAE